MAEVLPFSMSFGVMGSLVLLSYLLYLPKDLKVIWAGLNNPWAFAVWCVTASISTVGFLVFVARVLSSEPLFETIWPFDIFLTSAAMFMPLASRDLYVATVIVLAATAASSWWLVACSVSMFGWGAESVLLVVLGLHCTVVDLGYWAYTWCTQEAGHA
jgi:hypothetical protein